MDTRTFNRPLDLKQVTITDAFWHREQELVRKEVIPYQWEALNDRVADAVPSYCIHNFRVAGRLMQKRQEMGKAYIAPTYTFRGFDTLPADPAKPKPDRFYGFVFQDSDFSKWIEAVGYSLIQHPDAQLEQTAFSSEISTTSPLSAACSPSAFGFPSRAVTDRPISWAFSIV